MTLPAAFPLSMSQVATELGLSLPLSMNHAWVLALAGKADLPMSLSDLLGKTGSFNGNLSVAGGVNYANFHNGTPWFSTTLNVLGDGGGGTSYASLEMQSGSTWTANISVKNNTTNTTCVFSPHSSTEWRFVGAYQGTLIRSGYTDNFTILPSN